MPKFLIFYFYFFLIYNRWQTGASNKLRESRKWWIYSNGDTCCLMKTNDFSFFHTVITALLSFHLKVFRLWYRFVGLLECSPLPLNFPLTKSFSLSCLCWQRLMSSPREDVRLLPSHFPPFVKLFSLWTERPHTYLGAAIRVLCQQRYVITCHWGQRLGEEHRGHKESGTL